MKSKPTETTTTVRRITQALPSLLQLLGEKRKTAPIYILQFDIWDRSIVSEFGVWSNNTPNKTRRFIRKLARRCFKNPKCTYHDGSRRIPPHACFLDGGFVVAVTSLSDGKTSLQLARMVREAFKRPC